MKKEQYSNPKKNQLNGINNMKSSFNLKNSFLPFKPQRKLKLFESRILVYSINKINRDDWDERTNFGKKDPDYSYPYESKMLAFTVAEFVKITGSDSSMAYKSIHKSCSSLISSSIITKTENKNEYLTWFEKITFCNKTNTVQFIFSKHIIPFLTCFGAGCYTKGAVETALRLRSDYSWLIYLLLVQYINLPTAYKDKIRKINLKEFKEYMGICGIKNYEKLSIIIRDILNPVKKDINKMSEIQIDYEILEEQDEVYVLFKFQDKKALSKIKDSKKTHKTPVDRYKKELEEEKEKAKQEEKCLPPPDWNKNIKSTKQISL